MTPNFNIDEIYTVSDFLSLCNKTIEHNIPTCWLQGEISNLSRPASGHWYFSLKDNQRQIRCALFRLNQRNIRFNPENGIAILVRAAPTLYEARGDFQLVVQHIEPVGVGNLHLAFEQLKNKLKAEGMFDNIHKKPLPLEVNTIGVVSSSNGAVIQDIIKILNKRYPFAKILLFDTVVQGEGSAEKITQALQAADNSSQCDVLIIARGGGSLEDLWAFNEEALIRAIFAAKTPIISAIGHETDTTIADFVSDVHASTPSAAAMLATPDRLELLSRLKKLYLNLSKSTQQMLTNHHNQLKQLSLSMPSLNRQLNLLAQRLDGLNTHLSYRTKTSISLNQGKLSTLFERLKQYSPSANIVHKKQLHALSKIQLKQNIKRFIEQQQNQLNILHGQLNGAIHHKIKWQKNQLAIHTLGLDHLSPLSTLSRGYSITTLDNHVVRLVADVKIGSPIITVMHDGKIYSHVEKIEKQ